MVRSFSFSKLPLIFFGEGKITQLPGLIRKYGNTVLFVTGMNSFMRSETWKMLEAHFNSERIRYYHYPVPGEPSPALIDNAVSQFRRELPALVVAIGGGSVMDAGKAISAMLPSGDGIKSYLEGIGTKEHPGTKVPFIAVPTTSGTGSEATRNAVISEVGDNGFKKSLRHENFVPDIAIVDPGLTITCPAELTAAGGMDCFTQLVEAYLSDKANEYTDALAIQGIKAVLQSLVRAYRDGNDRDARAGMSFAALTSGICLANAGLGTVHGFASSLGALFSIPHGIVCGSLMAVANEANVTVLRERKNNSDALKKYAALGKLLPGKAGDDDLYISRFVLMLHEMTKALNLPGLGKYGVGHEDVERVVSITENKNNPVQLTREELCRVLLARL